MCIHMFLGWCAHAYIICFSCVVFLQVHLIGMSIHMFLGLCAYAYILLSICWNLFSLTGFIASDTHERVFRLCYRFLEHFSPVYSYCLDAVLEVFRSIFS